MPTVAVVGALVACTMLQSGRVLRPLRPLLFKPISAMSSSTSLLQAVAVDGLSCDPITVAFPPNQYQLDAVVILEASGASQETLVERALALESTGAEGDPYGGVLWPAAKAISKRLLATSPAELKNSRYIEIGTGTGLVALVAALCGAKHVLATDFNPFSLQLVNQAMQMQPDGRKITCAQLSTQIFDVCDFDAYPDLPANCDVLLVADLLYSPKTGECVARRVHQAVQRNMRVLVADSPLRPGRPRFLEELSKLLGRQVEFNTVPGEPVSEGVRHELIATRSNDGLRTLDMAILEL